MPPAHCTLHAAPTLALCEAISQCFCHKSCPKFDSAINKTWLKQQLERIFLVCRSWTAAVGQLCGAGAGGGVVAEPEWLRGMHDPLPGSTAV